MKVTEDTIDLKRLKFAQRKILKKILPDCLFYKALQENSSEIKKSMFISKSAPRIHYEAYIVPGEGHFCTIKYPDGSLHQGEANIDTKQPIIEPHGFGILVKDNGEYYLGEFEHGVKAGKGEEVGEEFTYVGDFANGKPNGIGSVLGKNGKVMYEGEVKNGNFHGSGRLVSGKNVEYDGFFEEGTKVGDFVVRFPKGDAGENKYFIGDFVAGQDDVSTGHLITLVTQAKTNSKLDGKTDDIEIKEGCCKVCTIF